MVNKKWIKFRLLFRQNWIAFSIVIIWFFGNYMAFLTLFILGVQGLVNNPFLDALLVLFYFTEINFIYANFYRVFSELIIFGLIFSLITVELFRKYRPEETCRLISQRMEDHIVIVGYSHLGRRIYEYLEESGKDCVIIERDVDKVENLVEKEHPVVIDDARETQAFIDANVEEASLVFVAANDLETILLSVERIREITHKIPIIARCFEDDFADIIEKTFNVKTLSTSKFASERINEVMQKHGKVVPIIIGLNHISERLMKDWNQQNISYQVVTDFEEEEEEERHPSCIEGDPTDLEFLKQINIEKFDFVVILIDDAKDVVLITRRIRELNSDCYIIARIFSDDIAEFLSQPPFNSKVISSTKETLNYLDEKGVFGHIHPDHWVFKRD